MKLNQYCAISIKLYLFFSTFFTYALAENVSLPPGLSYRLNCQDRLHGHHELIEVMQKTLRGSRWPDGTKQNFSLLEFNLENMMDHVDAAKNQTNYKLIPSRSYNQYAKPKHQLESIAGIFKKHRPLACLCVEIGNISLLREFDEEFLDDSYEEFLLEGNDARGLDIGLLIDKRLPLRIEVHSHRKLYDDHRKDYVFSRDLPAFLFFEKTHQNPFLILFGTHFKSQIGSRMDPNGANKRQQQALAASHIIRWYESQYPGTPIILTGDFNNDWHRAREFEPLKKIGLREAFDLTPDTVYPSQRGTHYYFEAGRRLNIQPLDTFLFNPTAAGLGLIQSASILAHVNKDGNDLGPPRTSVERQFRGSDHLPVQINLNFEGLLGL